jgi:hypothetical protein
LQLADLRVLRQDSKGDETEGYRLTPKADETLLGRLVTIAGPQVNKPAR